MRLSFITTNQGKIDFFTIVMEPLIENGKLEGIDIEALEDLPELQLDSVADVCTAKVKQRLLAHRYSLHMSCRLQRRTHD